MMQRSLFNVENNIQKITSVINLNVADSRTIGAGFLKIVAR